MFIMDQEQIERLIKHPVAKGRAPPGIEETTFT